MSNLNISQLRELNPRILCLGRHPAIIQSILDFDYLSGRDQPSIVAVIASGRRTERYFFGQNEITLPIFTSLNQLPPAMQDDINLVLNVTSGRRVLDSTRAAIRALPGLVGGIIFAESLPERHALELIDLAAEYRLWLLGGASVGVVVPPCLKLGAIGGIQPEQFEQSRLFESGTVAVISSSGGMVNEIIRTVSSSGHALSFALALGGERFPVTSPGQAFLAAQADPATTTIVYFGELGGDDEYVLADLLRTRQVTKPVVAYIAGAAAELFETPPQFGHAKAMAATTGESAHAKSTALAAAGAVMAPTYNQFVQLIRDLPATPPPPSPAAATGLLAAAPFAATYATHDPATTTPSTAHSSSAKAQKGSAAEGPLTGLRPAATLTGRRAALIASSLSRDTGATTEVLGSDLLELAERRSFAAIAMSMFLGHPLTSPLLEQFTDFTLRLLVDHGPYVSGAVNTIITARAGRDLESALATGLLTIGPRFGGAINQSAAVWLSGVTDQTPPSELVESVASRRHRLPGIGHRKYRADLPDPRVQRLLRFTDDLPARPYADYARAVEAITIRKKGNLILNVDGAIAAILLDLLSQTEHYTPERLRSLVDAEFFNALFVLSRSVGFMAHYFDQLRLDEGLFRLRPDDVSSLK